MQYFQTINQASPSDPLSIGDVDGQFGPDATTRFPVADTGIACNDTTVTLTGKTYANEKFSGTDSIDASDCVTGGCHTY